MKKRKISYFVQTLIPSFVVNTVLSIKYKCFIHPLAKIYWPGNLQLSKGVRIGRGTIITAQGKKNAVIIGQNAIIEDYCILNNKKGNIVIGKNTAINHFCMIQATGTTRIGNGNAIAPYTRIVPNHVYSNRENMGIGPTEIGQTEIGDNCWIGTGVTIIIGVNVGKNSIVGANAVVNKSIPSNSVAVGVPAKVVKGSSQ